MFRHKQKHKKHNQQKMKKKEGKKPNTERENDYVGVGIYV